MPIPKLTRSSEPALIETVPPFDRCENVRQNELRPRASVLLVVPVDGLPPVPLAESCLEIRRAAPWAALVVCKNSDLALLGGLAAVGVKAALECQDLSVDRLRAVLTEADSLPVEVEHWLRATRLDCPYSTIASVRTQVELGLGVAKDRNRQPDRTVNRRLRSTELKTAGWWRGVGRCLNGVLHLQRNPELTLLSGAFRAGYSDSAGFSRG